MKRILSSLASAFALLLTVASATAQTPNFASLSAAPLESLGGISIASPSLVYNSVPANLSQLLAFPVRGGSLGFDDYRTTLAGSHETMRLTSMQFVGGVTVAGGVLAFEFFDSNANPFSVLTGQLPQAGNFIWTLTIGDAFEFLVPTNGILQIRALGNAQGRFWLTPTPPSVGFNDPAFGGGVTTNGTPLYHAFSLTGAVPEPGAVALLVGAGVAGAGVLVRRRKK